MCRWVQELKMPDGYVSNLDRCVNVAQEKFFDMKSHNRHIFIECLVLVTLRDLPDHLWRPLNEFSGISETCVHPLLGLMIFW